MTELELQRGDGVNIDEDSEIVEKMGVGVLHIKENKWKITLWENTHCHTHKAPNWFWRKMQYLCFGFKWEPL
jgi:hypothetical protein